MTLWQLQMLAALAEQGSLQAASKRLLRTQSAISMGLRKLEETAAFPLFDRDGYRLTLTARGEQFLRQAQEVIKQQARLQSLTEQLQHGAEPQLCLAYDHTCDATLLVPAIRSLQERFPATELLLQGESQLKALRLIRDGEADLALCPWLPLFRQYGDFETKLIAPFRLAVVMSAKLAESVGGVPTIREDLLDLPMLIPQNQETGISMDAMLRLPGQSRVRVNDSNTQREMLLAGLGWGVIPEQLVRRVLDEGELIRLSIPGFISKVNLEVHLVRAADRIAGPAATHIWEAL